MKNTLLLTPAVHYANEIPLLAAISAFILIFRERERPEEERKLFVFGDSCFTSERVPINNSALGRQERA